jgi:hypothetical protein
VRRSQEFLADWHKYEVLDTYEAQSELYVSSIKNAVCILHEANKHHGRGLDIVVAPQKERAVFANREFALRELVIVPMTLSISLKKVGDQIPSTALFLKQLFKPIALPNVIFKVCLLPKLNFPVDASGSSGHTQKTVTSPSVAVFWLVRDTTEKKKANVMLEQKCVKIEISTGEVSKTASVEIPVYVNTRVLKKGEELMVFKATPQTPEPKANSSDKRPLNASGPSSKRRAV